MDDKLPCGRDQRQISEECYATIKNVPAWWIASGFHGFSIGALVGAIVAALWSSGPNRDDFFPIFFGVAATLGGGIMLYDYYNRRLQAIKEMNFICQATSLKCKVHSKIDEPVRKYTIHSKTGPTYYTQVICRPLDPGEDDVRLVVRRDAVRAAAIGANVLVFYSQSSREIVVYTSGYRCVLTDCAHDAVLQFADTVDVFLANAVIEAGFVN